MREEIMVENACGRKAGRPWKEGSTAESCVVGAAITIASLSPHASISSRMIKSVAQTPDALTYSIGPHPGELLYVSNAEQQRRTPDKGAV